MPDVVDPLQLPAWVEFTEWRTGLKAHEFSTPPEQDGAAARAVLYLDRKGRVTLPPGDPYLPVVFASARGRPSGRSAEWHRAAAPVVAEMTTRGTRNLIWLPPGVDDIRPWRWGGFQVRVGYTYWIDLPYGPSAMDRGARRACERAMAKGMTVARIDDVTPVIDCLQETEARKHFSHGIGPRELGVARDLLGPESLRMYGSFDAHGRPAAAIVLIVRPGASAIAWIGGARTEHRADGAHQLLLHGLIDDLSDAGATGLNLCGASIPSVAQSKSEWGGRLMPVYGVRTYSLRAGARFALDWVHAMRGASGT